MKKKYILLLCLHVFLSSLLVLSASAHGGKTDSNGGHYDDSTGEYHYHHGYPAHDHRDADGDGDVDCPYNFDDKTNHDSNSSDSDSNSATSNSTEPQIAHKKVAFWDVIGVMIIWLFPALGLSQFVLIVLGGLIERIFGEVDENREWIISLIIWGVSFLIIYIFLIWDTLK